MGYGRFTNEEKIRNEFRQLLEVKNKEISELQIKVANACYMICDMSVKHRQMGEIIKKAPRQIDRYTGLIEAVYQEFIEKKNFL